MRITPPAPDDVSTSLYPRDGTGIIRREGVVHHRPFRYAGWY